MTVYYIVSWMFWGRGVWGPGGGLKINMGTGGGGAAAVG